MTPIRLAVVALLAVSYAAISVAAQSYTPVPTGLAADGSDVLAIGSTRQLGVTLGNPLMGGGDLHIRVTCHDANVHTLSPEPAVLTIPAEQMESTSTVTLTVGQATTTGRCTFVAADPAETRTDQWEGRLYFQVASISVVTGLLTSDEVLFAGEQVNTTLMVNTPTDSDLELEMDCTGVGPIAVTIPEGQQSGVASMRVSLLPAETTGTCEVKHTGGDARFAPFIVPAIPFTTKQATLTHTLQGLRPDGKADSGSVLTLSMVASDPITEEELVVHTDCTNVANFKVESLRIRIDATNSYTSEIQLPTNQATPFTVVCTHRYGRGDLRYQQAVLTPTTFVVGPPDAGGDGSSGDQDGSTGADGSSGSDPSGAGSTGGLCPDGECSAVVQASSGVALLLALAAAMAAMRD